MPFPGLSPSCGGLVVAMSFAQTTTLLACSSETTALAVLVDGLGNPVDAGVAANGLVLRIDEDDFVVLISRVLVNPV